MLLSTCKLNVRCIKLKYIIHHIQRHPSRRINVIYCMQTFEYMQIICIFSSVCMYIKSYAQTPKYGVASTTRLLKIIGLFCERALQKNDILQKDLKFEGAY